MEENGIFVNEKRQDKVWAQDVRQSISAEELLRCKNRDALWRTSPSTPDVANVAGDEGPEEGLDRRAGCGGRTRVRICDWLRRR